MSKLFAPRTSSLRRYGLPHLPIPSSLVLPPVEELPRYQAHPNCKIAPLPKRRTISNGGHKRGCRDRTNPRNRHESLTGSALFGYFLDLFVDAISLVF